MSEENFPTNILKLIAAEMHFQSGLSAAREMFGKSYFSLGVAEKAVVDQAVITHVGSNYRDITPEFLSSQEPRQPVGFGTTHGSPPANPEPKTGA